jgi:predicted nuclease with TOPRIM domain
LEALEREQYMKARHKKIISAEAKLIQKQQNEMNALKKKLEANLNERLKLREVEHNKLLQRYQNVKKEIENQQNIERIKFEKAYKGTLAQAGIRPGTATQRSMMASKMGSRMKASKMAGSPGNGNPASKPSYMK